MKMNLLRSLSCVLAVCLAASACSSSEGSPDGATPDLAPPIDQGAEDAATVMDAGDLDVPAADLGAPDVDDRPAMVDDRAEDVRDAGDVSVTRDVAPDTTQDVAMDVARDVATDRGAMDVPPVDPLAGRGMVELVRGRFMFTEGPQWRSREGDLVFSDIPANTIFRLGAMDAITMFRMPSDSSNGLAVDMMGRLLAAEHGSRSVTRTRPDGTRETLASHFTEGGNRRRLNSPNDLIVRSDGTVYFTDPPYGISAGQQELSFNGVYRIAPSGALTAEWRGATSSRPNGVVLSPDERVLYVADTADGTVRAWAVQADGALMGERMFVRTSGNPDGMAIDRAGNLYVSTRTGVEVFAPDGRRWGVIAIPEQPANCAFGGADARTLYVTARTGLYSTRVNVPGPP